MSNQTFSFNERVGARTAAAGYLAAPSYIGSQSPDTPGGGICVVSSALYQVALASGMKIRERVPHLRTMQTVLPGLDATVWDGGADLKFVNTLPFPIAIDCQDDDNSVTLQIKGAQRRPEFKLSRQERLGTNRQLEVEVFREDDGHLNLVSRDLYWLAAPFPAKTGTNQTSHN